jgi:hypothetical protein
MLIGIRNNILLTGILLSLIFIAGFSLFLYAIFSADRTVDDTIFEEHHYWWFVYGEVKENNYFFISVIIGLAILLVFSFSFGLAFRSLFKRIASPEVFFFSLFLSLLSLESFRLLNLFFRLSWNFVFPGIICSRIVYFGRFFGLLCFLLSSLYSIEVKYQKYGNLLGVAFILSIILTYIVPLDSSVFLSTFLYKLGDEMGVFIIYFGLSFIILINFIVATIMRQRRFIYIVIASIFILVGRDFFSFNINPLTLVLGFISILSGTILFYVQMGKIYLW